jgi:hypothetical protein
MPLASQSFGYMLIFVNPGIVLISFTISSLLGLRKKSTLAIPSQQSVLKVLIAIPFISSIDFFSSFAGISRIAPFSSTYLEPLTK